MLEKIAENLLVHVFYRVSAVVVRKKEYGICAVQVFDTEFGMAMVDVPKGAREITLISNHPEGLPLPYDADRENIRWLRRKAPHARVRLFICGEDLGCWETALAEQKEL